MRRTIDTVSVIGEDGAEDQAIIEQQWMHEKGGWSPQSKKIVLKSTGESLFQVDANLFISRSGYSFYR